MIEDILDFYNKYDSCIKLLFVLIVYVFGLFTTKLHRLHQSRLLRRILSLKKAPIEIVMPVRNGKISASSITTSPSDNYVTYAESMTIIEIYKLSSVIRKNDDYNVVYGSSQIIMSQSNNYFFVGGYHANVFVQNLFLEKFKNVKFSCSEETFSQYQSLQPILEVFSCKDPNKRRICVNGKMLFSYDHNREGYIVLIKLTGDSDFHNCDHGTYHICFGNNSKTTLAAIKCYNESLKELYGRLKTHCDHYFIVIKCINNQPDFQDFYDITNDVLT